MSAPIAPGDWVEKFTEAHRPHNFSGAAPYQPVGVLRQVERVVDYTADGGDVGLELVGLTGCYPNTVVRWNWMAKNWRPVYRPSSKLIEQLSQPVDIPADEPVSVPA